MSGTDGSSSGSDEDDDVHLPPDAPVGEVLSYDNRAVGVRGILRSGVILSVGALLVNGFNALFHFATARFMGPDEYSLLTTMFAVFIVATVPLLAIQATVTRDTAAMVAEGDDHGFSLVLRSAMRTLLRAGVVLVAVALVLFYPLSSVLNVERPLPIVAVIVAFLVQLPGPVITGALQATERYWSLTLAGMAQSTLKLAAGVGLAALSFGASAVTLGFAFATAVGILIGYLFVRPYLVDTGGHHLPSRRIIGRYALGAALALGLNTALVNADLIWARGTLTPHEAGLYAAASVATGVLLLIPIGLNTVLFSRVAKLRGDTGERPHLLIGVAAVAVIATPCIAIFAAFPTALLHIGFGSAYDDAAPWLWELGIAMGIYAICIVYLNHLLALGRGSIGWVLLGVFATQQLLLLAHRGAVSDIIEVQIACATLLVAGCEVFLWATNSAQEPLVNQPH